jgi:diacylglycerol kinase (ATP)
VRRVVLLINPFFTSRNRRELPGILEVFRQAGIEVEQIESTLNGVSNEALRRAIDPAHNPADAVIVCGGDGTVFYALQVLAGTPTPLGICPFGTGNVLAQNLGIPRDPAKAVRWLLEARPRSYPLGKITCQTPGGARSWYFAMAAGMGGHSAMLKASERYGKRWNGRLSYFAAGAEILSSHSVEPFEAEVTLLSGEVIQRNVSEMIAVRVAALNHWRPGGGLELPFLRLASVEGSSRLRLIRGSLEALLFGAGSRERPSRPGDAAQYEDVSRIECRPIPGRRYRQPLDIQADGEILNSSSATLEMAGVNLSLLTSPHP